MGPALLLACETEIAYRRETMMKTMARARRPRRTVAVEGEPAVARRRWPLTRTAAVARHG